MRRFRDVRAILLALWLGGAALFAAAVAPAAFAALSRSDAGLVVGRILPIVFVAGIVVGSITVLIDSAAKRAGAKVIHAPAVVLVMACAFGQFWVAPRIQALRAQIGGALDAIPAADPRRAEFGRLHALSVGLLGVAMLATLVAIVHGIVAARRSA